jgi:hypothetical protein
MFLNDFANDIQAQTTALPDRFGGEEGFKNPPPNFIWNAGAGVGNLRDNLTILLKNGNLQSPFIIHCLQGIVD